MQGNQTETQSLLVRPVLEGYFQLSKAHSDIYFQLATDCSLETSLQVFGRFLRNERETSHKKGKKVPVPERLTVTVFVKPLDWTEPQRHSEEFQRHFQGLVCCGGSPSRGWYDKIIFSSTQNQRLEFKLASPTSLPLKLGTLLNEYRFFDIGSTGIVTEKLIHSKEELDALFAEKQRKLIKIPALEEQNDIFQVLGEKPGVLVLEDYEDRSTVYKTFSGTPDQGNLTRDNVSLSLSNTSSEYQRMQAQYKGQIKSYQQQVVALAQKLDSKVVEIDELKAQVAYLITEMKKYAPLPQTIAAHAINESERMEEDKQYKSDSNTESVGQ